MRPLVITLASSHGPQFIREVIYYVDCWLQKSERELDGHWWVAILHQLAVLPRRHAAIPRRRSVHHFNLPYRQATVL